MIANPLSPFSLVWLVDFEFSQPDGERLEPLCMVAREWRTGETLRWWRDDLVGRDVAPIHTGPDDLFVAYYASAELGCYLSLGWPLPVRILDLCVEFKCLTSGLPTACGHGLLGALTHYGLDGIDAADKGAMRELAMRGGDYTDGERRALLDYCQSDVDALAKLLPIMLPSIDVPRALLRGRYMAAVARMERTGIPIDVPLLDRLRESWRPLKRRLVREVDRDFGVYVPAGRALHPVIQDEAEGAGIDPHNLAEAVTHVHHEERGSRLELVEAVKAARKATGLTPARIARWEDQGGDHSTWPGLDIQARELAGMYPALGIGPGYQIETVYDDTDFAARLWELLRDDETRLPRRFDPEILNRAAQLVGNAGSADHSDVPLSFSAAKFADFLIRNDIPWPRLPSGALAMDDDTFRQMAKGYPQLAPLRELRHSLSELRLESLAVGSDGRNRCLLSAFASRTGRNQPSNTRYIFGPSVWLRGLIRPERGYALAYVDWSQQEFGIAAALSGDRAMMEAYKSGDPYLAFARQAGAVQADATKKTHGDIREQFKVCALAVQYGMAEKSLAERLGVCEARGRELLRLHKETYPTFWKWSQAAVDHAMLYGSLHTVFGWQVHVGPVVNPRSLANFPMQANGAEMLRLACCLATERGVEVCGPVHDALLIEAPEFLIDEAVEDCQAAMREASAVVLAGFELRTDAKIVAYPDRYSDARGLRFWETVWSLLDGSKPVAPCDTLAENMLHGATPNMLHGATGTCCTKLHPYSLSLSLSDVSLR
ncbi:MAG: DNA polymerase [Planctomycetes bacterium]|nr:DNA polymerase [Planctomycetota bacterium]